MQVPSKANVCFGDFVLDLSTGELRSNGTKTYLQEKPFQILALLLERPGQLVTREHLVKQLWPDGTFVDFDQSLNKAVNRLREALDDSAEQPKFIETLPRRGYRFIAPLKEMPEASTEHHARTEREQSAASGAAMAPKSRQLMMMVGFFCLLSVVVSLLVWKVSQARSAALIRSIAVLPLENLSADAAQDYFADGMTDELITNLGQIGSIRVISRTSIMRYKGVLKPLPQIASELDVDGVVEGTVFRSGDRVRITAQLIQARTDRHLWAGSYEGNGRDVLSLQNEVAAAIAGQIRIKLTPEQRSSLKNQRAISPEAHEAYLRAIGEKSTTDGLQRSISYFEQAIAKEPNYPEAHIRLGGIYLTLGHRAALPPQEAFPQAKSEALKALETDQSLAEAHALLADTMFLYDWDFPGAEKEFRRAIALNPNSTGAHSSYSQFLSAMGRSDEAFMEATRSRQIDPLSLSPINSIGYQEYFAGRYDLAAQNAQRVLAIDPNNYVAHLIFGLSLEQQRQYSNAIEELQKAVDQSNNRMWSNFIAHAKALAGDKAGARKILADLKAQSQHTYVSPWCFAIIYAAFGDEEQAFFWLEKCYEGREHDLAFSRVWPVFDPIRSDPRYDDLMRRVGLPH